MMQDGVEMMWTPDDQRYHSHLTYFGSLCDWLKCQVSGTEGITAAVRLRRNIACTVMICASSWISRSGNGTPKKQ
jgi:hypothetical protein